MEEQIPEKIEFVKALDLNQELSVIFVHSVQNTDVRFSESILRIKITLVLFLKKNPTIFSFASQKREQTG